ncbi:MAG: hypothetical protein AAF849_03350 [Bacteroidota bacterium]
MSNNNDKLSLLHILSATAASNTPPSNKTNTDQSVATKPNFSNHANTTDTAVETTVIEAPPNEKLNSLEGELENLNFENRAAATATESSEAVNLDEESRAAIKDANMRTFASNVTTSADTDLKAPKQAISIEEEVEAIPFVAEEAALQDDLEEDTSVLHADRNWEEKLFEPLEETAIANEEIDAEDMELAVGEEQSTDTDYLDNPDNFDAEDIDEAYRKRLIALGLEPLEPIMTSDSATPADALEPEETATATLETNTDLEEEEIEGEENPQVDDALTHLFANPPAVPLPKTPKTTEALPTETHFSPLNFQEDKASTNTQNKLKQTPSKASMLQQFRQLQDRNSTFVFMFGRQQAGKTVILSSLAYHMGVDENGLLETRRRVDNLKGAAYLKQLSQSVRKGQFMNRTAVGSLYELDLTYTPNKPEIPMNFTFLEMSGEDLSKVELSESSAGQLPNDIDVYLKCPNLNLVFMMVVPYEDAEEHDYLVIDFLDYLKERKPDIDYSKILLLISKWDRYEGLRKNEVDLFVKEQMPRTYSRLKAKKATIARYSIGNVSDDGESITELNTERPEVIKKWMYQATTGHKIKDESSSIWNKFKQWM